MRKRKYRKKEEKDVDKNRILEKAKFVLGGEGHI